jgi:hypothetical protein
VNDGDPAALKFASSAAHLAGRRFTSAETFTWLTEHFRTSLSQCKPELDLMLASGVNRVVFHGSTYSPQDAPWPGWKFYAAVDMSPTNTIWRDAPAFFQYIARAQSFLQSGEPDADFLLYFPLYDIWHEHRGNHFLSFPIHGMRERLAEFYADVDTIMAAGYDVDYISDRFIRSSTVENGFIRTSGGSLYKSLIIPRVKRMPPETLAHIRNMASQGARIYFAGDYPSDVPGLYRMQERRQEMAKIIEQLMREKTVTAGAGTIIPQGFEAGAESFVSDKSGTMIRRRHEHGHIYFFSMLRNQAVDGWVRLGTNPASAIFYDPMSGKMGNAILRNNQGATEVYMQLRPGESLILKTFDRPNSAASNWEYFKPTGRAVDLQSEWRMHFIESDPPLESSAYLIDKPISWTEIPGDSLSVNRGTALYAKSFILRKSVGMEYRLCLGDVRESASVTVNGQHAGVLFAVPFEINVGHLLREGENSIEISVTNLPANRISDYDRRGVEWRIFREINFVGIHYRNETFSHWQPLPSGLLGPAKLLELEPMPQP